SSSCNELRNQLNQIGWPKMSTGITVHASDIEIYQHIERVCELLFQIQSNCQVVCNVIQEQQQQQQQQQQPQISNGKEEQRETLFSQYGCGSKWSNWLVVDIFMEGIAKRFRYLFDLRNDNAKQFVKSPWVFMNFLMEVWRDNMETMEHILNPLLEEMWWNDEFNSNESANASHKIEPYKPHSIIEKLFVSNGVQLITAKCQEIFDLLQIKAPSSNDKPKPGSKEEAVNNEEKMADANKKQDEVPDKVAELVINDMIKFQLILFQMSVCLYPWTRDTLSANVFTLLNNEKNDWVKRKLFQMEKIKVNKVLNNIQTTGQPFAIVHPSYQVTNTYWLTHVLNILLTVLNHCKDEIFCIPNVWIRLDWTQAIILQLLNIISDFFNINFVSHSNCKDEEDWIVICGLFNSCGYLSMFLKNWERMDEFVLLNSARAYLWLHPDQQQNDLPFLSCDTVHDTFKLFSKNHLAGNTDADTTFFHDFVENINKLLYENMEMVANKLINICKNNALGEYLKLCKWGEVDEIDIKDNHSTDSDTDSDIEYKQMASTRKSKSFESDPHWAQMLEFWDQWLQRLFQYLPDPLFHQLLDFVVAKMDIMVICFFLFALLKESKFFYHQASKSLIHDLKFLILFFDEYCYKWSHQNPPDPSNVMNWRKEYQSQYIFSDQSKRMKLINGLIVLLELDEIKLLQLIQILKSRQNKEEQEPEKTTFIERLHHDLSSIKQSQILSECELESLSLEQIEMVVKRIPETKSK
ncbi:hypothetical protein RFI_10842, partial [Reticulomyxa filosa]